MKSRLSKIVCLGGLLLSGCFDTGQIQHLSDQIIDAYTQTVLFSSKLDYAVCLYRERYRQYPDNLGEFTNFISQELNPQWFADVRFLSGNFAADQSSQTVTMAFSIATDDQTKLQIRLTDQLDADYYFTASYQGVQLGSKDAISLLQYITGKADLDAGQLSQYSLACNPDNPSEHDLPKIINEVRFIKHLGTPTAGQ